LTNADAFDHESKHKRAESVEEWARGLVRRALSESAVKAGWYWNGQMYRLPPRMAHFTWLYEHPDAEPLRQTIGLDPLVGMNLYDLHKKLTEVDAIRVIAAGRDINLQLPWNRSGLRTAQAAVRALGLSSDYERVYLEPWWESRADRAAAGKGTLEQFMRARDLAAFKPRPWSLVEMAVEPWMHEGPLFRSVSPWELENIIETGYITGKGAWFSGDRQRTAGGIWFGTSLEAVASHGTDWRRYVESTDEFRRAFALKRAIEKLQGEVSPPPGADWVTRTRWPEWKRRLRKQLGDLFRKFQDQLFDKLGSIVRQATKQQREISAYVIEIAPIPSIPATVYTGKDSLAGGGTYDPKDPPEKRYSPPEVLMHKRPIKDEIVRIYAVGEVPVEGGRRKYKTLATWNRPGTGWTKDTLQRLHRRDKLGGRKGLRIPNVVKGLAHMDRMTDTAERKFRDLRDKAQEQQSKEYIAQKKAAAKARREITEAIEFRDAGPSPLTYYRGDNIQRLVLCDTTVTEPPGKYDKYFAHIERWRKVSKGRKPRRLKRPVLDEIIPGVDDNCIVAFLDWSQIGPTTYYIHYVKSRQDKRGKGYARRIIEEFYRRHPDATHIDWGKMMQPSIGHLFQKMQQLFPDVVSTGHRFF